VNAGYQVSLIVADGRGDEIKDGISIFDVGTSKTRLDRMHLTVRRVFEKAKIQQADIYHLHDPELIPIGLKLKKLGKKVIFDAHEDVSKQLLSKPYLIKPIKKFFAALFPVYEKWACSKFDGIVTATDDILKNFVYHEKAVSIRNFPILKSFESLDKKNNLYSDVFRIVYVGGLSEIRGLIQMIESLQYLNNNIRLILCGQFDPPDLELKIKNLKGFEKVEYLGLVAIEKIPGILNTANAGILCFLPEPNHIGAMPNKLFEYMAAGLPVIASNFPFWKKIIENCGCGICVNPLNPKEIAGGIEYLSKDHSQCERMGEKGRKAVTDMFNWEKEGEKLLTLYNEVCKDE
jgi:glycosyltransferase involved in cell wall biosynthesis